MVDPLPVAGLMTPRLPGAVPGAARDGHAGQRAEVAADDPAAAERALVRELARTDREVRAHERAHLAAAGGLARGGAIYSYQRGPDGQLYAVGGEVSIDLAPGATPEETLDRARRIRAAALAPANPSAQDRAVAARASQMALEAQIELAQERSSGERSIPLPGHGNRLSADAAVAFYRGNEAAAIAPRRGLIDVYV